MKAYYLVEYTTEDKWELESGWMIVPAEDIDDAYAKANQHPQLQLQWNKVKNITPIEGGEIIEICTPLVE